MQLNGLRTSDGICIAYELFCDNAYTDHGFKITDEQSEKGIQFLTKLLFKKNGDRRKTKLTNDLPDLIFHCLKNFSHFSFVGLENYSENQWSNYMPVYRIHATDGSFSDYVYLGWRSNTHSELDLIHFSDNRELTDDQKTPIEYSHLKLVVNR